MTIQQGTWLAKDVTEKNFLQRYGMATELAAEGSDMAFKKGGSGGSEFFVLGHDDSDQFDNKSGPVMKLEKSNLHHLLSLRSGTSSTGEVVMDFCGRGVGSNQLRGQKTPTIGLSFPQDGCASELNSNLLFPAADELYTENDQIVEDSLHTSNLQTTLPSQQEFLKEAMCTLLERVSEPLETLDQADKVVLVEASSPQPFRTTQSSSFLHTDSINKESAFVNASSALVQGNMPVNDECVVQKKRESYLELYEGGGSDRRRFPSSSSKPKVI
ncbi:hypothetical protein O6H91_Y349800 [Diphasiastrum complanatum]|nr:hypothetical protein O6H91_Y349800 [Diphasiastrum complanatum]